jgi:hypothetical protein
LGLGPRLTISLWSELCGYLLIKFWFVNSNGLLKSKIWTSCLTRSQNTKMYIDSHSKFVIRTQYVMEYRMINSYKEVFFENLSHLTVRYFWMVKIW